MKVHTLKAGEPEYGDIVSGKKQTLILPAGTDYQVGDLLMICQFLHNNFTGPNIGKRVGYIKSGSGQVPEGYVMLGLEECENTVDSTVVAVNVLREGYDFLSRSKFGDCPHCGKQITSDKSPEKCCECGGPIIWSESRFG